MKYIGDDDVVSVPPYRTQCGRRIMIYRLGNWDPRKYSVEEIFKATIIILELGVLEPRAQILGGTVIFDLEGITMAHAWTITPQVSLFALRLKDNQRDIFPQILLLKRLKKFSTDDTSGCRDEQASCIDLLFTVLETNSPPRPPILSPFIHPEYPVKWRLVQSRATNGSPLKLQQSVNFSTFFRALFNWILSFDGSLIHREKESFERWSIHAFGSTLKVFEKSCFR